MTLEPIKILYLGDVFGEPGRRAVAHFVPRLRDEYGLDLVLANCENVAKGKGVSTKVAKELFAVGVDFMTSGNHIFDVDEFVPYLNSPECRVLRPYNLSPSSPGKGVGIVESKSGVKVGLINIMGRLFMDLGANLPFDAVDEALLKIKDDCDVIVVDMHAETTSEKRAMGWHLDGRVALVVGTHTHVQTADEGILAKGTAYITDLGMCGPYDSIIGMEKEKVLKKFRTGLREKFEPAGGDIRLCGVICEIDVRTKRAVSIERIQLKL